MDEALKNAIDLSLGPLLISDLIQTPITTLVHLLSLYIIVRDTPPIMNEYKKYLLITQLWLFAKDLMWNVLVRPVYIYPFNADACVGILSWLFHLDCHYQFSSLNLSIGLIVSSLTTLMIYRRNQIIPPGRYHFSPQTLIILNILGYLIEIATAILFFIAGLGYEKIEMGPQYQSFISARYTLNSLMIASYINLFIQAIWTMIFAVLFIFSIVFELAKAKERMSPKTFELQKYFSNTLFLQLGAVFIFFLFPIGVIVLGLFFKLFNIWIINYVIIIQSYYSIIYSFLLLGKTPVYRDAIKAKFHRKNEAVDLSHH